VGISANGTADDTNLSTTTTIVAEQTGEEDDKKKGKGAAVGGVFATLIVLGVLFGVWWVYFKGRDRYENWMHPPPDTTNVAAIYNAPPTAAVQSNTNAPGVYIGIPSGSNETSTDDLSPESLPTTWFVPILTKEECTLHVSAASKYQFLVRNSSVKGAYAICVNVGDKLKAVTYLIEPDADGKFTTNFCSERFSQVQQLVVFWQTNELTPKPGLTFKLATGAAHGQSKFVAESIRLGAVELSATPLAEVMGVNPKSFHVNDKIKAMRDEIEAHGTDDDIANFNELLDETFRRPGSAVDDPPWHKSLSDVMLTQEAIQADLKLHHVLALQLYTTSTFSSINFPLRQEPIQKPNPFGCITFYISEGLGKLRQIKSKTETLKVNTYWRGMRDRSISDEFMSQGGAEMACMSTTVSRKVAESFADSKCPLLFQLTSRSFMSHGADISFLSVYPEEKESLFPPLTYLRPIARREEIVGERLMIIVEVEPVYGQ
jgi:hypothetical protein